MKKKIKAGIIVLACVLLLSIISIYSIPKLRVALFVNIYHELFEEGLASRQGVPADDAVFLGYEAINHWDGSHPMFEIVNVSYGRIPRKTYYGCYYSSDDVPLAFQNTDTELIQSGNDCWTWNAEGDNHGETSKIMDHWYFFKASY